MIIVLDPCKLGFQPTPDGGILQITEVEGLLSDIRLLIPMGEEALKALNLEIQKRLSSMAIDTSGDVESALRTREAAGGLRG